MKDWQFWLLLGLIGATFYLTLRMALGLQKAQTNVSNVTTGINDFLGRFGLKL